MCPQPLCFGARVLYCMQKLASRARADAFYRGDRRMRTQREVAVRFVLYGCRNNERLQVGGRWLAGWFFIRQRRMQLDWILMKAGFSLFGSLIQRFSSKADDGYTYVGVIGQSAITIHTYPELGTATVYVVTCPGEDEDGSATTNLERILRWHFRANHVEKKLLDYVPLQRAA